MTFRIRMLTVWVSLLLAAPLLSAQSSIYSGTVVDESGEPVIGAGVLLEGGTQGTVTGLDGEFTIEAPRGASLLVSSLGYLSQSIKLDSQLNLRIVLRTDATLLEETVRRAYLRRFPAPGSMLPSSLTSSIRRHARRRKTLESIRNMRCSRTLSASAACHLARIMSP